MDSYENMYKTICRVCLSQNINENMVSLTENSSNDGLSCYGKAIAILTSVSLPKHDKLPSMMCHKCVFLLKQAIYFKLKCESTDQKLKRLVGFNINKDASDVNIKEIVCDYVIYNQYFHEESNLEDSSNVSRNKNVIKPLEICHKNDQKNSSEDVEIVDESVDSIFDFDDTVNNEDIINNLKENKTPSNEEIDSILETMQKMVDSESKVMVNIKPRKPKEGKKPIINIKKLHKQEIKLKKHQKFLISAPNSQRNIQCKICNKVLANRLTFKHHMGRHNIVDCRYICDQCGKAFPVLTEMHMHQITRHGIGPYLQCDSCPYKAPRKLDLIEHIRLHTGERPFTCEKCGKSFRRKAIWKNHIVSHMDKQFQCSFCPRKFFRHHQMLEHQNNIHIRMYMYLCSICNVTYASIRNVRRHMIAKHGIPREKQGKVIKITNTDNEFPEK